MVYDVDPIEYFFEEVEVYLYNNGKITYKDLIIVQYN